MPIFPRWLFS